MNQRIVFGLLLIFVVFSLPEKLWAARLELRPAGADGNATAIQVGDEIEVELWVDSENQPLSGAAVFLSFDADHLALVDEDRAAQTGFQPFAPGGFLSNGEIFRNYLLDEEDPAASAPGIQLDYSVVRAADQGAGPIASFRLRALMPAADLQVRIDESGARETRFFLPDGDQRAFRFITPLQLTVQGITISGLPQRLVLPRGGLHQLSLVNHVFDPQYSSDQITWTVSSVGALQGHHNREDNALVLQAPSDASPWEQVILTATNPAGQTTSDTLEIFVNDGPQFASIDPINLSEDAPYSLPLDALVSDGDTPFEQLQWTMETPPEITLALDADTRTAQIVPQANWHGQTHAVLIARDEFDFADTLRIDIAVAPVNDPPRLLAAPNVRLTRGRSDNSLLLGDLLDDVEDSSEALRLSWIGNEHVQLHISEGRLVVSADPDWTGSEEITLVVEDSGQLTTSGPLVVTVIPSLAPALVSQPERLSIAAGTSYVLELDDLVVDPDDADETLYWQVTGHQQLDVQLSGSRMARIEAPSGFVGVETIQFTVSDPTGEQTSFSVDIYSLPASGQPLFAALPEIRIPVDGVDASIDLDRYVFDLDHASSEMDFFLPQRADVSLRVDAQSHVLVIEPRAEAVPSILEIVVRVVDPDGNEAVQTLRLYLLDAEGQSGALFSLSPLSDIELTQGQTHAFALDEYVGGDIAPSDVVWVFERNEYILADIDPETRTVSLRAQSDWHGETTISFIARIDDQPEQRLSARIVVSAPIVTPEEPPPTLDALPDISLEEGAFDQRIELDQFISNARAADFSWSISGGDKARVLIDPETQRLIVFAGEDWEGEELFQLVGVRDDGARIETTLRVVVVLPRPAFSLAEQTQIGLFTGTTEIRLQLGDLLTGQVNPTDVLWTAQGLQPVNVHYDEALGELVLTRATPWESDDTIELRAALPDGSSASGQIAAQVYANDGSMGTPSSNFVLVPLPNALQPTFLDLFIIDQIGSTAPPQLRINDGTWSDLSISEGPEDIWQSSHVLTPGQEGSVSIVALSIVESTLFRSSYDFEVGTVRSGSGKRIRHADITLEMEENAFAGDAVVALLPNPVGDSGPELVALSPAYTAHSPQPYTGRGGYLSAEVTGASSDRAGLYHYRDGRWEWMETTRTGNSLRAALSTLGRYALFEDRTPPSVTRHGEHRLHIADAGSGIARVEVFWGEALIPATAYAWDGTQLLLDPTYLPARENNLRVEATDHAGNIQELDLSARGSAYPQHARLLQNFPNPFNPSTAIPFAVYTEQHVRLTIYNSAGQRVRQLVDEHVPPGQHVLQWDAHDERGNPVSSGTYIYRLEYSGQVQVRKMTLLR